MPLRKTWDTGRFVPEWRWTNFPFSGWSKFPTTFKAYQRAPAFGYQRPRLLLFLDNYKQNVYYWFMIKSFRCRETEKIFHRIFSRKFPHDIQDRAFMKLNAIDAAAHLEDLRLPPSNRLEALGGERKGQWGIRINDQ